MKVAVIIEANIIEKNSFTLLTAAACVRELFFYEC